MPFVIATDPDGSHHASNGAVGMSVLPDKLQANRFVSEARLFKRKALKNAMTPSVHEVEWLIGEIDGVRCYVKVEGLRVNVVMTRQELYP